MGRERYLTQRAQIINPIQPRLLIRRIVSTQENVHRVRVTRTDGLGQGTTDPGCGCAWAEGVEMTDLEETDVAFDVFCELDGVAWVMYS